MRSSVREAWRATVYLGLGFGLTFGSYLFVTVLLVAVVATVTVVGAGMLPETVLLTRGFAIAKRRHVLEWTGRSVAVAYLPVDGRLRDRIRGVLRDPTTWADFRWMFANYGTGLLVIPAIVAWPIAVAVDGFVCGMLRRPAVMCPLIVGLADLDARWARRLLEPSPKALLIARVDTLAETRAGAVAEHGAELRRIERDLHDGTQARLVALSLRIGLARRMFATDPDATLAMLETAQSEIDAALTELRDVVRSIYPPILADRGLAGAISALVAGNGLEIHLHMRDVEQGPRAPLAVEAAAYFVVAEALTNIVKHSGSDDADIILDRIPAGLRITVSDSGHGGAEVLDPALAESSYGAGGSGLLGMRRRVAALDGTLTLSSPHGGPTTIRVELPCVW